MMKKLFFKFSMLLFVLAMSMNAAWAEDEDPTLWLAALKAQTDPASTGTGNVRLTLLDIQGLPMQNPMFVSPTGLNSTNPTPSEGFAEMAQMIGATIGMSPAMNIESRAIAMGTSFDPQLYLTSYVYFHAEAEPANGSYLADWTFTDDAIHRIDTAFGDYVRNAIGQIVGDAVPSRYPCFKVLPEMGTGVYFSDPDDPEEKASQLYNVAVKMYDVNASPNNLYALFYKYLLSNPTATGASLDATVGNTANLSVTLDVAGEAASLDAEDFANAFTFTNNTNSEWSYDLSGATYDVINAQLTRVTIPVTFTVQEGTTYGVKTSTMTISMAGSSPSSVNVSLNVNAMDPNPAEAFLFDGETAMETEKLTLEELLAVDISGYAKPILRLNAAVATDLTFAGKNLTLDLHGNSVQDITVSSGEVMFAYSQFGGTAGDLIVEGGKVILNGCTFASLNISAGATVEQNGALITGAVTNNGTLTTTEGTVNGGLTSTGALTLNGGLFKGETAVTVNGGTALLNRATIIGTTCGLKVTDGEATVKKLAAITGGTYSAQNVGGTLTVECGKFGAPLNGTIDFTSGFFTNTEYGVSTEGKTEMLIAAGVEYNEGYRHFLGSKESALANGVGVCRIGTTSYAKLEDALAYANNNPGIANIVIFMTNDYTLPAGYYTLPANATIVVPMSDTQEKEVNLTTPRVVYNDQNASTPYVQPTEFRRLTFANGVNMDVFGAIEMTCTQFASNEAYTSQPYGPYGHLVMEEGSHMTLQDGSHVRAWGYITGQGEIDARRGSTVHELFQMGDWKGAMTSVRITGLVKQNEVDPALWNAVKGGTSSGDDSDKKIFPVTQYFIQNVESPVKYHPGAVLTGNATVSEGLLGLSVSVSASDIAIVGVSGTDDAIFLMDIAADADNTWVRKWYDVENDVQVYDINSGAHIGSMVLDMGNMNLLQYGSVPIRLNSAKFDLPITSNMKIHLLSGSMDFQQNTNLLPGAEVEVDKESTVSVAMSTAEKTAYQTWVAGGKVGDAPVSFTGALYVYDAEDWDKYAYCNEVYYKEDTEEWKTRSSKAYTKTVRYSPSWEGRGTTPGKPDVRNEQTKPASAAINVRGTFTTATGFVYTSEHGANIFSNNEDAGTFIFNENAEEAGTRTVYQVEGVGTYRSKTFYPAKLKNGVADPAFANTADAHEGDAYCYTDNVWNIFEVAEDDCFMKDDYSTYYAKPQEYVAINAIWDGEKMVGNEDHTFSDAAGAGRLFILMKNCQWWEVEKKDNLYHCIHSDNDTYYYWVDEVIDKNNSEEPEDWDITPGHWEEKRFTITWLNWDGTPIETNNGNELSYSVTYGTMAEFLSTNPTREANIDYTYDFTGWTPALGPVTSNVTYTATYTQKPRMYTIIFQQEGGVEIERQFLTHNEVPVCENVPTKVGHTLQWSPAIAAVTGDATYTATWLENPPTEYEVTFYDYNGTTVLQQGNVAVGAMPVAPANPTGKPATDEFTYVFDHWSPALEEVSATSIKSYTAVYREEAKTYLITFLNEDNSEIEHHNYQYGETPVCLNMPTKANTAEWTYKLAWDPQIQTVMGTATYKADFETLKTKNKYTVSVMSNPSGACAISGAGIYDYNTSATAVTITITPNPGYTFAGWSDDPENTNTTRQMAITADINLVANFDVEDPDVTITWKSEDGNTTLAEVGQKENTATIYTGAMPTKAADAHYTYTFDGWTTEANGAGTFYKNNMTPKATVNATYYAHFAATEVIMEVGLGQAQNIAEATTVNQLIINSNGTVSGQLTGAALLNVTGACYYDLTGTFTAGKWYAVAVPWQVTAGMITANGSPLSWNSGNYLAYYDGSVRAAQGKVDACWKYVSNCDVLVPGRLYMLYLENSASLLRFPKKTGAPILNTFTGVGAFNSAAPADANWNGIANPAIFYAYLSNTGATVGQVFNADAQSYEAVALSNKLIVAKPIFVQATNNGSATAVTIPPASAPVRRNAAAESLNAEYQVEIASYGRMQDRLFINTNEDKEADTYTIGQDVLKFGVSDKVAQMWVNRYDAKLCMNTMAPVNSVVEFPLSIFAPRAGEYTIAIEKEKASEDHTLYLTYNGEAIWNLSENAYTLDLQNGIDANYGLRISVKNAPQTTTGMDEAIVDAQGETRKVLINNQVFIIRGDKVYSIDGQLVK